MINGKYCCPKIYFNHRCFSGPYLNKGRIAELPQCVGPGNCVLVLREVRVEQNWKIYFTALLETHSHKGPQAIGAQLWVLCEVTDFSCVLDNDLGT